MDNIYSENDSSLRTEVEVYDPEFSLRYKNRLSGKDKKSDHKYLIYPFTDLKYKKQRSVDLARLIKYNPNVPELRIANLDRIEFRFLECKKNNYESLDLSHLGLTSLPQKLPNVKYLFLSDNRLTSVYDLSRLTRLTVVDMSSNKLTTLPNLPSGLVELSCRNNQISCIATLMKTGVKRIDVSFNQLTIVPLIARLEDLRCDNNLIKKIKPIVGLKSLKANNNRLTDVSHLPSLVFLHIDHNQLTSIRSMPRLVDLYASNNLITDLNDLPRLQLVQIKHNRIRRLCRLPSVEVMYVDHNMIDRLGDYPNLLTLSANHNSIRSTGAMPRLESMHINFNRLDKLNSYPDLLTAHANNNRITSVEVMPKLQTLQLKNNDVCRIPYIKTLQQLVGDYRKLTQVSSKYVIDKNVRYRDGTVMITFITPKAKQIHSDNNGVQH